MISQDEYKSSSLLHLRLIELSVKLGCIKQLVEKLRALSLENPKEPSFQVAVVLAEQHGEIITPFDAAIRFQELLKLHGGSAALHYGLGFSMEVTANLDRALYNYDQSINCDPTFYPGFFGLSQVHYQRGDDAKGDYYFKLFEEAAPFNVYGNFETHRQLSNEFLDDEKFDEAETAIKTLGEWWIDNKGVCPPEIQVYEGFSMARIAERRGDPGTANALSQKTKNLAFMVLNDLNASVGVLYFIAKTLEEFSQFEVALHFYQKILSRETVDAEMVQRIGSQFLSLGEYDLSKQLFESAYRHQPDNPEIGFCLLIAKLRLADVNVEDYLLAKERMKQLVSNPIDRVELLSVLHNLLAKFNGDAEVHNHLGDIYLRLGNVERAKKHYRTMFEIDPLSRTSALKYAGFELQFGDEAMAMEILERFEGKKNLPLADINEINWLKASNFLKQKQYQKSRKALAKPLAFDPWNVSYVVFDIVNMICLASDDARPIDPLLEKLMIGNEEDLNWNAFDRKTEEWAQAHQYELVYMREKLRYLYSDRRGDILMRVVQRACAFDATRATYDFLKLLNTNFDGPEIYWALGMLFKENWQLETASVWFEQILNLPNKTRVYEARAFLELADCYIWREINLEKAIEYAKISLNMGEKSGGRAKIILAHAHLRLGQIKQAETYLQDSEIQNHTEATYLRGLVLYRNGAEEQANSIWKPLLTVRSENLRFHHIKQEILKYYFEKEPYLGIN